MTSKTPAQAAQAADSKQFANCVFHFPDGQPVFETVMPRAQAAAIAALAAARTDKHALLRAEGFRDFDSKLTGDGPEALKRAADSLSWMAHTFRSARWKETPMPRLKEQFFPEGWREDQSLSVLTDLVTAFQGAAVLGHQNTDKVREDLLGLLRIAYRYPSLSPREEAKLAAQGFSAAELLVTIACTVADAIARLYLSGPPKCRSDVTLAQETAQDALEVIEAGVAYTLEPERRLWSVEQAPPAQAEETQEAGER